NLLAVVGAFVARVVDQSAPTVTDADDLIAVAQRANRDGADGGIETGDVAAAGEDADCAFIHGAENRAALPLNQLRDSFGIMRRILLADADAFYVAVARAVDPDGAGKAPLLIVGGSRESRGVVCSASYETRKFGVRSAMPIARALRLCPDAVCVPVPFKACVQKSAEIRELLHQFSPVVEGASIDEWYIDLTGTEGVYRHEPLATTAQRIRSALREATGLTLSIGGGTNKLIAKLAVDR